MFDRLGGCREDLPFTNLHIDGILCLTFFDHTKRVRKVGNTYHLTHGRPGAAQRRLRYEYRNVDRTPQRSYGFADICVETPVTPRITRLTLREDLRGEAEAREEPEPRIPSAYQTAPPGLGKAKRHFLQARYALSRRLNRR